MKIFIVVLLALLVIVPPVFAKTSSFRSSSSKMRMTAPKPAKAATTVQKISKPTTKPVIRPTAKPVAQATTKPQPKTTARPTQRPVQQQQVVQQKSWNPFASNFILWMFLFGSLNHTNTNNTHVKVATPSATLVPTRTK